MRTLSVWLLISTLAPPAVASRREEPVTPPDAELQPTASQPKKEAAPDWFELVCGSDRRMTDDLVRLAEKLRHSDGAPHRGQLALVVAGLASLHVSRPRSQPFVECPPLPDPLPDVLVELKRIPTEEIPQAHRDDWDAYLATIEAAVGR